MDGRTTRRREKDGSSIALAWWWYLTGFEKTSSRRWRSQWPTTWAFGCCLDKLKKEKDEKVSLLYESGKIQITHMMTLLWLNHEKIFFHSWLLYEVSVHTLSYHCMLALFFWKNCQLTGNHKFFGSCLEFFNSSVTNQEEDVLKMLSINHFKRKNTYKNTWFYSASFNLWCASKLVTRSHSIFIAKMETNKLSSTYPPQGTNYRAQCVQFL